VWRLQRYRFHDGQRLYSGSDDEAVRVRSTAVGAPLQTLEGHTSGVCALAVSADGQRRYSGSKHRTVRVRWKVH